MAEGTEGIASTATDSAAPSTSLGGEATQSQVDAPGDAWGQLSQGGDGQSSEVSGQTSETAAPTSDLRPPISGSQEAASPEGQVVQPAAQTEDGSTAVIKAEEEDPFDSITDPKKEDFQAIRANRKEVVAKLNAAEPLVAAIEKIGGVEVLGMVAPLLQPFESLETGLQTARDFVTKVGEFDPQVDKVLKEALYERHKNTYFGWALQDNGIQQEDFQSFLDWKEGGGQPAAQSIAFPEPDAEGYVQMPDGTVLDTAGDPGHKLAYELHKKDFQREQADNTEKARVNADLKTAAETKLKQERDGRVHTFMQERETVFDAAYAKLTIDCGPDTDTAKEMIEAMVRSSLGQNPEFAALSVEAKRLAAEGGGASASKGLALDRIAFKALADSTEKVTNLYRELHQLRQQVQGGRPQIPGQQSQTQPSTFKPNDTPPPVSPGGPTNAVDDIWKQVSQP